MQARNRPTHINFCQSIDDFHRGKIQRVPIEEAENRIAKYRNIRAFTWAESFTQLETSHIVGTDIINPDDLALCYFGDDIGYAPIAIKPIPPGKKLIFTGEICPEKEPIDSSNVYLVCDENGAVSQSDKSYIDAKHIGGFASMFMDLPDHDDIAKLNKKNIDTKQILVANIFAIVKQVQKFTIVIISTQRELLPGEILGMSYAYTARLLYKEFVGFTKDGQRLTPDLNAALNCVLNARICFSYLQGQEKLLMKGLNALFKKKYAKASSVFTANIDLGEQLTVGELKDLVTHAPVDNRSFFASILEKYPEKTHKYLLRQLVDHIKAISERQLQFKGKSPVYMHGNSSEKHFLIYPGSERDMYILAKLNEDLYGLTNTTLAYYKTTLFFAAQNRNTTAEFVSDVANTLEAARQ